MSNLFLSHFPFSELILTLSFLVFSGLANLSGCFVVEVSFVLLLLKISKRKIDALGPPFLMMLFFFLDKQTEIMY